MKHFKDTITNEIYAYAIDGSQDEFIKEGLVEISNTEADTIRAEQKQTAFDTLQYSQKRAIEYPPITDYLDGIVKGDQVQIQTYIDACLAVKAKYPKP